MNEEKIQTIFQTIKQLPAEVEWSAAEQFVLLQPATVYTPPSGGGGHGGWLNMKNGLVMITSAAVVGIAIQVLVTQGVNNTSVRAAVRMVNSNHTGAIYPFHSDTPALGSGVMYGPNAYASKEEESPSDIWLPAEESVIAAPVPPEPEPLTVSSAPSTPAYPYYYVDHADHGYRDNQKELPPFSEIEVLTNADVDIVSGKGYYIEIEFGKAEEKEFNNEVRGNRLYISNPGRNNCNGGVHITVTVPENQLKKIILLGSGDINLLSGFEGVNSFEVQGSGSIYTKKDIRSSDLTVKVAGSGHIEMKDLRAANTQVEIRGSGSVYGRGNSSSLVVQVLGSGHAGFENCVVQTAELTLSGSGSADVYVGEKLDAKVMGSGTVSYSGSPTVNQSVTGSGEVVKKK